MGYTRLKDIDLQESMNSRVYITALVTNVLVSPQKNGGKYATLTCVDEGKNIKIKMFGYTEGTIEPGKVYDIRADVQEYPEGSGSIALKVYGKPEENLEADYKLFVDIMKERETAINTINKALYGYETNRLIVVLARNLIYNNSNIFAHVAAGKKMHHNKIGGLVVHTAEVMNISLKLADTVEMFYPDIKIDRELLIVAACLHDIGKIKEIVTDNIGESEYSTDSYLESHIVTGCRMIEHEAYELGFFDKESHSKEEIDANEKDLKLLIHCINSHHGQMDWGSPVTPAIIEAHIISMADIMSAKLYQVTSTLSDLKNGEAGKFWTHDGNVNVFKP